MVFDILQHFLFKGGRDLVGGARRGILVNIECECYTTPYNVTLEESSLCGTRSRHQSEENTLPMSLKWIFLRNAYYI
jgi:hypothetical protein